MNNVMEERTEGEKRYSIAAALVHKLIISIIGAIIATGGYMVLWGINDARWKGTMETQFTEQINNLSTAVSELRAAVSTGILPRADERIKGIEKHHEVLDRRVDSLDSRVNNLEKQSGN